MGRNCYFERGVWCYVGLSEIELELAFATVLVYITNRFHVGDEIVSYI
jgi:hypothetical protein